MMKNWGAPSTFDQKERSSGNLQKNKGISAEERRTGFRGNRMIEYLFRHSQEKG